MNPQPATVQHVRVDHGSLDVLVPQFLHRPDVVPVLQQMGGKRMPKRVARGRLGKASPPNRLATFVSDRKSVV